MEDFEYSWRDIILKCTNIKYAIIPIFTIDT